MTTAKQTNTLDTARDYLRRGWQPLPIPHGSKNPNLKGWQNLKLDEADLPKYFNGKPQNIGVLLGSISNGLTDIDLDSPEAVKLADFFLPKTDAEFGRAGKPRSHRLYLSDFPKIEKFEYGETIVEIRSNGGQTVFPPSTHTSGESVAWHKNGDAARIASNDLRRCVALLASACVISKTWKNSIRHELSLSVSGALLRNGFSEDETRNFIRAVCFASGDEETSDRLKSVETTAESLRKNRNVFGFPKLADLTDKKLVETVCKWLQIESKRETSANQPKENNLEFSEMPRPLDLTLKPVETIDDDCLPSVLTDWLRPAAKVIGCPFDFLVLSAIITAGSLIGSRLRLKPLENSDWFIVPNLYGGLVGLPSTKKTPALDETRKPVLELQAEARKDFEEILKDFEIEAKYFERETSAIYRNKELNLEQIKTQVKELEEPNKPILKRYETNDITASKLIQFLAENPHGLTLFRDELTGWLKSLDADYNASARPFFLELWKGGIAYELARVDGREIQLTSGTLSIIGGVQPSKLQRYVSEAYSFDNSDGFLQRFLFAYPDTSKRAGKPTASEYEQMRTGYASANKTFKTLAEFEFNQNVSGANGDKFQVVKFSRNAQKTVDQWQDENENEAESLQIEDEPFSSFLYKLPKSCFAVALIFHALENIQQNSFPDEISETTALKAIAYTEVLISHARRVFALGENQIFSLAQTLLGKIKKEQLPYGFKARDVMRKQWSGLRTKDTVQDVLKLLIDYGYLRELESKGGRPTFIYYVHPSLIKETEK